MRAAWLRLSDDELLRECRVDRFRASGPGGQKRNKTESAIRLRHGPSGLSSVATESRSQHENRARAVRRLREKLALDLREPVDVNADPVALRPELAALLADGLPPKAARNGAPYLEAMGQLLDVLSFARGSIRDTGTCLGLGSSATSKLLTADDRVARRANAIRRDFGLKPLR